jgi:hypothetical protein
LKSEIIKFIQDAEIIVADLTNERPNCYLEVGFAMGIDKFRNIILTAKEDHNPTSPNHVKGGPRIHFDLSGYDILFWSPEKIEDFQSELTKRIKRRRLIISSATPRSPWDIEWIQLERDKAILGLRQSGFEGFMEIRFAVDHPKPQFLQKSLLESGEKAEIKSFGWPIAVTLEREDCRPRPRSSGIVAEISIPEDKIYDYWAIQRNGDFYLLQSLFEDWRTKPGTFIFYDTRIVRVTEALLYCARLYSNLGIDRSTRVNFAVRHGGLSGRRMSSTTSGFFRDGATAAENTIDEETSFPLEEIESNLVGIVKRLLASLFVVFNFTELPDSVYENTVSKFAQGIVV